MPQGLEVQVLSWAHSAKRPALMQVFLLNVSRSDVLLANKTARQGRGILRVAASKISLTKTPESRAGANYLVTRDQAAPLLLWG